MSAFFCGAKAMISGYPQLTVSGGLGATIKLTYSEALYDADMKKGRSRPGGRPQGAGYFDTFIADGARRSFMPLWWRTWRYAELEIQTGKAPLKTGSLARLPDRVSFQKDRSFHQQRCRAETASGRWAGAPHWSTPMKSIWTAPMGAASVYRRHAVADADLLCGVRRSPLGAVQAIDAFAESNAEGRAATRCLSQPQRQCHCHFFAGLGRHVERLVDGGSPVPR